MQESSPEFWRDGALRMFESADSSMKNGYHEVALFTFHLSVENMLKSYYTLHKQKAPPKTHNLVELSVVCDIALSQEEKEQLTELSTFSAYARYGDESWIDANTDTAQMERVRKFTSECLEKFNPYHE